MLSPLEFLADLIPYPPLIYRFSFDTIIGILVVFGTNFIVNSVILTVGYLVLKRKKIIKSWKFLKYIFFVTLGGAIIDVVLVYSSIILLSKFIRFLPIYSVYQLIDQPGVRLFSLFVGVVGFFILGFYNYWLSKKCLNLIQKEAIIIGSIIGVLTNPVWILIYLLYQVSTMIIDPLISL
ncbi:MAG: hypothetical protein O2U61_03880 [Candidatus Bathyarchaeota archaeon]|nr:hypothetical protein [Candidatus Bathyarchaeota archaeon]